MHALLVLCAGFIVTLAGCEWLRPPGKLQSVLPRIALIHLAGLLTTAVILLAGGRMRPVPIFIFWSGAALAWFGCRSHLESSILLRMVYMLHGTPQSADELISRYHAHGGQHERVAELVRAGWLGADLGGAAMVLTAKGRRLVALLSRLR